MSRNVLEDIRRTTESDNDLRQVKHCIQNEWPSYKEFTANRTLQTFWKIKDFLTVVDGLILKGEKIVIPRELQPEILRKLHTGHMGREKTKRRARNLVYWPNINSATHAWISEIKILRNLWS
jgi:hypothetical protein